MIRTEESSRRRICHVSASAQRQTNKGGCRLDRIDFISWSWSSGQPRPPTLDSSQITDSRPRDSRIMSRDPYIDVKRYSTHPDLLPR